LIEQETLEALARDHGVALAPHEHRRNLTTRGVALNHLVGHYFAVGECVLYGGRLNVPCRYLEELLGKKVFKPLVNRSGLNARVIVGGTLRTGDVILPLDPARWLRHITLPLTCHSSRHRLSATRARPALDPLPASSA